ncbi:MAG: Hpt domain-containing protein, partial [Pseudomonadota bacterium]
MLNTHAAARAQAVQWARPHLEALCDTIRLALENWAGEADAKAPDMAQAEAAASQLYLTLNTLELRGDSALAGHVHNAIQALGDEPNADAAGTILEAIAMLPANLERLETGAPDLPEIWQATIDQLQALTGDDADPVQIPEIEADAYTEQELTQAQGVLTGRNRDLFTAVAQAALGALNEAKSNLNEHLLGRADEHSSTEPIAQLLTSVAESIHMLSLDRLAERVSAQADALDDISAEVDDPALQSVANELLLVESELEESVLFLGEPPADDLLHDDDSGLPVAELRRVMRQLVHEALDNLNQAKHQLDQQHRGQGDEDGARQAAFMLQQTADVLHMAGLGDAAELLSASAGWIESKLIGHEYDALDRDQLESLAEALIVTEFYLDSLNRHDQRGAEFLDQARARLIDLGYLAHADRAEDTPSVAVEAEEDDVQTEPEFESALDDDDFDLKAIFLEEFDEQVNSLQVQFPDWHDALDDQELLTDIRRAFHTMKGSGRMAGAQQIGEFSWAFEQVLNRTLDGQYEAEQVVELIGEAIAQLPELRNRFVEDSDSALPQAAEALVARAEQVDQPEQMPELIGLDPALIQLMIKEIGEHLQTVEAWVDHSRQQGWPQDVTSELVLSLHTIKGTLRLAPIGDEADSLQAVENYMQDLLDDEQAPDEGAIELLADVQTLLGHRLNRLQNQPVADAHFDTSGLTEQANALSQALLRSSAPEPEQPHTALDESVSAEADAAMAEALAAQAVEAAAIAAEDDATDRLADDTSADAEASEDDAESGDVETDADDIDRADEAEQPKDVEAQADAEGAEAQDAADAEIEAVEAEVQEETEVESTEHEALIEADEIDQTDDVEDQADAEEPQAEAGIDEEETTAEIEAEAQTDEIDGDAEAEIAEVKAEAEIEDAEVEDEAADDAVAEDESELEPSAEDETPIDDDGSAADLESDIQTSDITIRREAEFEAWPEADLGTLDTPTTPIAKTPKADASVAQSNELAIDYNALDQDLLSLFVEEGHERLESADAVLQQWREQPEDRSLVTALQRDVHTIKGSARMAGLNAVGQVAHVLEDLLEGIAGGQEQATAERIDSLETGCDHLHAMVEAVDAREPMPKATHFGELDIEPAEALENEAVADNVLAPVTDRPADRASSIRMDSNRIEELLNFAGEVSIFRSRIEQEISGFRNHVSEIEETVLRLRGQLRKLEQETETQILSRHERERDLDDSTFDPLEMDRYSTIQQLSRALAESVNDLNSLTELMDNSSRQSETLLMQQARVNTELQEGLMQARMVSFATIAPRLRRVVRNAARDTKKEAELHINLGGEGELDRNILDRMTAPIEHILRNAIAHGLETPAQRRKAKKDAAGQIVIDVEREATEMIIRISDDGKGLDLKKIRDKAIKQKLLTKKEARDDAVVSQMIFEPGFSTAGKVSELAGRGVGMEVVATETRQIGGRINVQSNAGQGAQFELRIPLSLAVMQAIFVQAGERPFAIPLQAVRGVARISPQEWQDSIGGDGLYRYGGEEYRLM